MRRFLQALLKGFGTLLVEFALWYADKKWGDAMFDWLKLQIPDGVEAWLLPAVEFSWDWGLPVAVGLVGLWLMFKKPTTEGSARPDDLAATAQAVVQRINELNAKYPLVMPDHPSYATVGRTQNEVAKLAYMQEYREKVATSALLALAAADKAGFLQPADRLYLKGDVIYGGVNFIREILLRVSVGQKPTKAKEDSEPALRATPDEASTRNPTPNIRLDDVLRLITGLATFPSSNEPGSMAVLKACETLREKALLQEISVFGGLNWRTAKPADWDNLIRAPIPAEYWQDHRIDVIDFLGADGSGDHRGRTIDLKGTWGDPKDYYGIWFNRDEIEALWPNDRLPLRDAMRLAYEALENHPNAKYFMEEANKGNSEDKLTNLANVLLCMEGDTFDLKAARPPSTISRPVDMGERDYVEMAEGTSNLRRTVSGSPAFENASISRAALRRFIERMKT